MLRNNKQSSKKSISKRRQRLDTKSLEKEEDQIKKKAIADKKRHILKKRVSIYFELKSKLNSRSKKRSPSSKEGQSGDSSGSFMCLYDKGKTYIYIYTLPKWVQGGDHVSHLRLALSLRQDKFPQPSNPMKLEKPALQGLGPRGYRVDQMRMTFL